METVGDSLLILASTATPVFVRDIDTSVALRRDTAAVARWVDTPSGDGRLSLQLDRVRGSRDATVLHLIMRLPEADAAQPSARQDVVLASAALYGLRRASLINPEQGLTLYLDITTHAVRLRPLLLASSNAPLALVIRTQPGQSQGAPIAIARVRIVCRG